MQNAEKFAEKYIKEVGKLLVDNSSEKNVLSELKANVLDLHRKQ